MTKNKNVQQKKRGGRKAGPKRLNINTSMGGNVWSIPKTIGFPDTTRCALRYTIPLTICSAGVTTQHFKYTSNAYDVDSALASTAMPYFAELAAVYSRFRTLAISYDFIVTNSETFPIQLTYGFLTQSFSSGSIGANYAGNAYMRTTTLTPINGSRSTVRVKGKITIEKLFGSAQALFDDLFTGSTTSSTLSSSATGYLYMIGVGAALSTAAGWFISGTIELDVLFNKRNALFV